MTKLLETAVEAVRRRPPAEQDVIAEAMLSMARPSAGDAIPAEDLHDVLAGLAELARGEIATEEEVAEAFRSFER